MSFVVGRIDDSEKGAGAIAVEVEATGQVAFAVEFEDSTRFADGCFGGWELESFGRECVEGS